ncbi:MAG TPA: hypothetical protein VE954_25710 [Oligoflexus sp.]|uniref:hypothetical protein n=1 Tax=Oligoflexus sp. TaxID=1971216 RepID=UPI002D381803|nr:hypothetical protein [Oligoflexus sp.]HYX36519.1 hypothetical protein [Oligoflexus sp.]
MRILRSTITSLLTLTLLTMNLGCQTKEDGQLKPLLANPEVAIPVAVANEIMGRSPTKLMKGEISQESGCMRHYPISRLRIALQAMDSGVKAGLRETTFYPSDRVFQKELELDSNSKYTIQLIYEPTNAVLFETKTTVRENFDVFFRINCPA